MLFSPSALQDLELLLRSQNDPNTQEQTRALDFEINYYSEILNAANNVDKSIVGLVSVYWQAPTS